MKFYVIGITDHPKPFFPPEVMAIISNGKVFSGGKRHHEIVAPLLPEGAEWIDITVPLDAVFEEFIVHSAKSIVIFASGDPLFLGLPIPSAGNCLRLKSLSTPPSTRCRCWHTAS